MRKDRTAPRPALALLSAAALAIAVPAAATAQAGANDAAVLVLPSLDAALAVVVPAPPPVAGWERAPEIEIVGADGAEGVVVYSPAPEPMPGWRKLQGVDIRTHGIAQAREPGGVTTHAWDPAAPSRIRYHDWRFADATAIPYARSGDALAAQSWNPAGARFEPSRIRRHGWPR